MADYPLSVPPQFIALCHASGVSPLATLRGMAVMLCGLRYDENNQLLPMEDPASRWPAQWARSRARLPPGSLVCCPVAGGEGMRMQEEAWCDAKRQLPVGSIVEGRVLRHEAYGMFVDVGLECEGLIQIVDISDDRPVTPADYPPVGERVVARVLGFKEDGYQVWLGIKPSQLRSGGTE